VRLLALRTDLFIDLRHGPVNVGDRQADLILLTIEALRLVRPLQQRVGETQVIHYPVKAGVLLARKGCTGEGQD
jgi:hypothetical protein